jgi:hypothetical protein
MKLTMEQWLFLVRKMAGMIEPWWGKFMSSGGRLILSNSHLASLPTFAMGLFLLRDGIHAKFDAHRARFYWEGEGMRGLGVINSKKMNIGLLLKWVWKLYQPENPIWAQILRAKYPSSENIFAGL